MVKCFFGEMLQLPCLWKTRCNSGAALGRCPSGCTHRTFAGPDQDAKPEVRGFYRSKTRKGCRQD